jgi:hypothetical protein
MFMFSYPQNKLMNEYDLTDTTYGKLSPSAGLKMETVLTCDAGKEVITICPL